MTLLTLYEKYDNSSLRGRILQCLGLHLYLVMKPSLTFAPGFLFRAQPTLMTMERSARIMDEIFASPEEEGKGRLLKIIQDFLVSEAAKHSAQQKGTNICALKRIFDLHIFYRVIEDQTQVQRRQHGRVGW